MSIFEDLDNPSDPDAPTLLIDGDLVAYQAASAADGRVYTVLKGCHDAKEFKYKEEATDYCKANDISINDIELDYTPEPVANAIHNMKLHLTQIQQASSKGESVIYLTGNTNYRKQIDPDYKANRGPLVRTPHHLAACKQWLLSKRDAIMTEGLEADDLMGSAQVAMMSEGKPCIICSLDKDLKCIPGLHYNWRSGVLSDISTQEADRFFYTQVLTGDSTDNVQGIKGIGPAKAQKWMDGACSDEPFELYSRAYQMYVDKTERRDIGIGGGATVPESSEDLTARIWEHFERTAKLVWIQREPWTTWVPPEA